MMYFPYSKLFFINENFLLKIFQSISTFPMKIGSLILHAMFYPFFETSNG